MIYLTTFLVSLLGGVVPVVNVEVYLLSVAVLAPHATVLPAALAAALGQMAAKSVLYLAGRGVLTLRFGRRFPQIEALRVRLQARRTGTDSVLLASALLGVPPFYLVSVVAGALRCPFDRFFALGCCGRVARFAVLLVLARSLAA